MNKYPFVVEYMFGFREWLDRVLNKPQHPQFWHRRKSYMPKRFLNEK